MDSWLMGIAAVLAIAGVIAISVFVREIFKRQKATDERIHFLEQQTKLLNTGAIGMGHRILGLEDKLQRLSTQESNLGLESEDFAYTQAKQMFAQGADIDTVAANCGFSSSEAELMSLIQKRMTKEASVS